jgi:hypothetical protein
LLRALYVRFTNLSTGIEQGLCQLVYYLYFSIRYELVPVFGVMAWHIFTLYRGAWHQNGALLCAVPGARNALDFGDIHYGTQR